MLGQGAVGAEQACAVTGWMQLTAVGRGRWHFCVSATVIGAGRVPGQAHTISWAFPNSGFSN